MLYIRCLISITVNCTVLYILSLPCFNPFPADFLKSRGHIGCIKAQLGSGKLKNVCKIIKCIFLREREQENAFSVFLSVIFSKTKIYI